MREDVRVVGARLRVSTPAPGEGWPAFPAVPRPQPWPPMESPGPPGVADDPRVPWSPVRASRPSPPDVGKFPRRQLALLGGQLIEAAVQRSGLEVGVAGRQTEAGKPVPAALVSHGGKCMTASAVVVRVQPVAVPAPDPIDNAGARVTRSVPSAPVAVHVGRTVGDARSVSGVQVRPGVRGSRGVTGVRGHRGSREARAHDRDVASTTAILRASRVFTASPFR